MDADDVMLKREKTVSFEHIINFLSKYISKGVTDMKFPPDVGNNPSNPHIQRNQTIDVHKLSYI